MHLRRVFTIYVVSLAVCLVFLSARTSPEPVRDVEWYGGGPAEVLVPEGADSPPKVLATPKGDRAVKALDLSDFDIPFTALLAYQRAADILAEVRPGCELPWTLLAAIGRVESNHGRYDGATLDADGVSSPRVIGVALDGHGDVAEIRDTDGGALDQDPTWDRAVGPMQFIPSTWEMVGVDGDGDGSRSIHDIDDAALAAGVYLCAGSSDLRDPISMKSALLRYNDSLHYAALVMAYEEAYRNGDFNISSPGGPVVAASAILTGPTLGATPLPVSARLGRKVREQIEANTRKAVAAAIKEGATTPGISAAPSSPSAGGSSSSGTSPNETQGATGSTGSASSPSGSQSGSEGSPSDSGSSDSSGPPSPPGSDTTGSSSSGSSSSGSSSSDAPSSPETSEPASDPPQTTPSEPTSSSPSAPDSDAGSGSTSQEPQACDTAGPDATVTPSPDPTDGTTADPCEPTDPSGDATGAATP